MVNGLIEVPFPRLSNVNRPLLWLLEVPLTLLHRFTNAECNNTRIVPIKFWDCRSWSNTGTLQVQWKSNGFLIFKVSDFLHWEILLIWKWSLIIGNVFCLTFGMSRQGVFQSSYWSTLHALFSESRMKEWRWIRLQSNYNSILCCEVNICFLYFYKFWLCYSNFVFC